MGRYQRSCSENKSRFTLINKKLKSNSAMYKFISLFGSALVSTLLKKKYHPRVLRPRVLRSCVRFPKGDYNLSF